MRGMTLLWWCSLKTVLACPFLVQVHAHVEDAVAKGARVTIGGKKPDLPEPYNKVHCASCNK